MSVPGQAQVEGPDDWSSTGHQPTDPGERGQLSVADRVVERVAGYAVTLVDGALAAPKRVLGVNVGESRPEEEAQVRARVHGSFATVEATIAVRWPASVHQVAADVRTRLRDEVARVAAVEVDYVDIDVVSLSAPQTPVPRVR